MLEASRSNKHYASAKRRFLHPLLSRYLHQELLYFGPDLSDQLAERIVGIFEALCPGPESLRPGQLLWNAVARDTRADSKNCRFVPVVLTLISKMDIERLRQGIAPPLIRREAIARVFHEAFEQGAVLSTRDASLLFHMDYSYTSQIRINYEKEHGQCLPHAGVLHDMGTTISHKVMIIRKVIHERKDPATVAAETRHTQQAVDHYLRDYHRVEILHKLDVDLEDIIQATGMSKSLVKQYLKLLKEVPNEYNP